VGSYAICAVVGTVGAAVKRFAYHLACFLIAIGVLLVACLGDGE
jgi:hypothetical protein